MYIGIGNTYAITPLVKMLIIPMEPMMGMDMPSASDMFSVLYNPQSFVMTRKVQQEKGSPGQKEYVPFGEIEILTMDLFVDTFAAGAEVMGLEMGKPFTEALKFTGNSLLPSMVKQLDAGEYADKIYDLSKPKSDTHMPPKLLLKWNSLNFGCVLKECAKEYVKFNEWGMPVRIVLHCGFMGISLKNAMLANPPNSPDTSKFARVSQGDSLWAMSGKAYGDIGQWRSIAAANGIANPRLLSTGDMLVMPALP